MKITRQVKSNAIIHLMNNSLIGDPNNQTIRGWEVAWAARESWTPYERTTRLATERFNAITNCGQHFERLFDGEMAAEALQFRQLVTKDWPSPFKPTPNGFRVDSYLERREGDRVVSRYVVYPTLPTVCAHLRQWIVGQARKKIGCTKGSVWVHWSLDNGQAPVAFAATLIRECVPIYCLSDPRRISEQQLEILVPDWLHGPMTEIVGEFHEGAMRKKALEKLCVAIVKNAPPDRDTALGLPDMIGKAGT